MVGSRGPFRLATDRRGGAATTVALGGAVLCGMAAAAIDLGSVALKARQVQAAADLAALAAARDLPRRDAAARATVQDNLGPAPVTEVRVLAGRYVADRALAPAQRFSPGAAEPNAARVTVTAPARLHFAHWIVGRQTVAITRTATAAVETARPMAMFSIGSRLAAMEGGVANALLSGLTGSTVSLNLMDYERLAGARVNLLDFTDALSSDLSLGVGDYDSLLEQSIDAGRALKVLEGVADGAESALSQLARAAHGRTIRLGDLIGVEAGAAQGLRGALDADIMVMDVVTALLQTGGERQVAADLGVQTGLAATQVFLAIGERPNRSPWLTVTADQQPVIRTAQARLLIRATTAQTLSGLARVELPIFVELAAAEARLKRIDCRPERAVTVEVRPGVARAGVGSVDLARLNDFTRALTPSRAELLNVAGLVRITARADIEVADTGFKPLKFSDADIVAQARRTAQSNGFVSGAVSTLLERLDVQVHALGLGLGLGGLTQALGVLLTPLGPVLDGVLAGVLDLLGLRLGEADVRVHDAVCPDRPATPVLVG